MDPDYASPVSAGKKTEYRPFHAAAAIIALVTGYLFIRWFVLPAQALAAFIFAEGFGLLSLAVVISRYVPVRKARPSPPACFLPPILHSRRCTLWLGKKTFSCLSRHF